MTKSVIFLYVVSLFIFSCSLAQNKNNIYITKFEEEFKSSQYTLVDVRTKEEFSEGYIQGAINIDYLSENFTIEIQKLDLLNPILFYCRSGNRSNKATQIIMHELGFQEVYNLEGGIKAWISESNPLITE